MGKKKSLIDPIYQKYTRSVIRALGSTEFYEFFMDAISHAENTFQFSNRKVEKTVDVKWVDAIEKTLASFQNIIASPRNVIHEEELIVNVANAKKGGSDVVRHLAQHANLVEKFDPEEGEVRPSKLMQKYREDSVGIYENRLVYTVLDTALNFVRIRHDALFSAMSDEFGAKLKIDSTMESATEMMHMDMFLHIKETDSALETDDKNQDIFGRISRLYRMLMMLMNTQFAQQLAKLPKVKGNVVKTNVLKRNPNYHKIIELWDFFHEYDEIGYSIRIIEQNPVINEEFETNIYHNILFNYLILKGYLEDERDREVPVAAKGRKRTLKPKFIKEIIEELTDDYDLPEVEIRKVLIEELTKAQLMQEEAAERRRLVEEQAQRKKEEQERLRKEKEAEKERLRKEKEAEKERIRQEKEAELERIHQEELAREIEDRRRRKYFKRELKFFMEKLPQRIAAREEAAAKKAQELQDFADAARLLEEAEQRKLEKIEREKRRIQEEKERIRQEKLRAAERARKEKQEKLEQERLAKLAEEERLKREAEERERERIRQEEERERERIRQEEAAKEAARQEQLAHDMYELRFYHAELLQFTSALDSRKAVRAEYVEAERLKRQEWEENRRRKQSAKSEA